MKCLLRSEMLQVPLLTSSVDVFLLPGLSFLNLAGSKGSRQMLQLLVPPSAAWAGLLFQSLLSLKDQDRGLQIEFSNCSIITIAQAALFKTKQKP